MPSLMRRPRPDLRPLVRSLWVASTDGSHVAGTREHAIPTGEMHLVVRLVEAPVRIFADRHDAVGRTFGHAVVAGPRDVFHVKDVCESTRAVGVQLHPAAARALFGVPASHLAGHHLALDDLWPTAEVARLRQQLLESATPAAQLDLLETAIAARLTCVRPLHPAVALALQAARGTDAVAAIVAATGFSHRTVATEFRQAMGLSPKRFLRVRRLRRLLPRIGSAPWDELALAAGFSDQAHLVREFTAITGVTPTAYLRARPEAAHHVRILQDGR